MEAARTAVPSRVHPHDNSTCMSKVTASGEATFFFFFNARTLPGSSIDDVIDAMELLVVINKIYSVQHHGVFNFQADVNSAEAVQLEAEGPCLGN